MRTVLYRECSLRSGSYRQTDDMHYARALPRSHSVDNNLRTIWFIWGPAWNDPQDPRLKTFMLMSFPLINNNVIMSASVFIQKKISHIDNQSYLILIL